MTIRGIDVTKKFEDKLKSSLSLPDKCRLASNAFSTNVCIPQKDEVVIGWLFAALDVKYRDRVNSVTDDDYCLWKCLQACLTVPGSKLVISKKVPALADTLLNLITHADLSREPVINCIMLLAEMSIPVASSYPQWINILTILLARLDVLSEQLVNTLYQVLQHIKLDSDCDNSAFLIQISKLYSTHPKSAAQTILGDFFYSNPESYQKLFSHLAGDDSKFRSNGVVSQLISSISEGCHPLMLIECCPAEPSWLKAKLFAMLLSCFGLPGLINSSSVIGGELLKCVQVNNGRDRVKFVEIALPVNISVEISPGRTTSKCIQDVVRFLMEEGTEEELVRIVHVVGKHHPLILEQLVGSLFVEYFKLTERSSSLLDVILEVMMKLRQLPKLLSKLLLQLRDSESTKEFSWKRGGLDSFGIALGTIPRVQYLEIWKTLNYHFEADILQHDSKIRVNNYVSVVVPLMATLFDNAQLVDHNLPTNLSVRVQDLIESSSNSLRAYLSNPECSNLPRESVYDAISKLVELSRMFVNYRAVEKCNSVSSLLEELMAEIKLRGNFEKLSKEVLFLCEENKNLQNIHSLSEIAASNLACDQESIKDMSNETLLKIVSTSPSIPNPKLRESLRWCSAVTYLLMSKINKYEIFFIPELEHWKPNFSLDSYLGKSIGSCFPTLMHSELKVSHVSIGDVQKLADLPVESLPPALKLGATFVCLSQMLISNSSTECINLLSRCLETTDLFRFVDAGKFLMLILEQSASESLFKALAASICRFSKPLKDVNDNWDALEAVLKCGTEHLIFMTYLLKSLAKSMDAAEGSEKSSQSKILAENLTRLLSTKFKNMNVEDHNQMTRLCEVAAVIIKCFGKSGLGKLSKFVRKICQYMLTENCLSGKTLLTEICSNLEYLDDDLLPENWRKLSWQKMLNSSDLTFHPLMRSMLKTATAQELDGMLTLFHEMEVINLSFLKLVINCEVKEGCEEVKRAAVEKAVSLVCKSSVQEDDKYLGQLPDFFAVVFCSSPPCVSAQVEVCCLATLTAVPKEFAEACLSSLALFLSRRSTLSTRSIPITMMIIRECIDNPSHEVVLALQKVLGLFSRHKADYSSVIPYLVTDLISLYSSVSSLSKSVLNTSLNSMLDMLDKHSFEFISNNLPPATNEIFKQILSTYNSSHKFKGKV